MPCDCNELANEIEYHEAQITVWEVARDVALAQIATHTNQLWYAQYNYYLCGCGGTMLKMERELVRDAILKRDDEIASGAVKVEMESLLRLHRLVVAHIRAEK